MHLPHCVVLIALFAHGPARAVPSEQEPPLAQPEPDQAGVEPAAAGHSRRDSTRVELSPRDGFGTSWQPDSTPVSALTHRGRAWTLTLQGNLLAGYDVQSSPRGGHRFFSTQWLSLMASRRMQGGQFSARIVLSADALTMPDGGAPLLLQTGQAWQGAPLVDRQHPQELFQELALTYTHPLGKTLNLQFYASPAGAPALGPVSYLHRTSALFNPFAPLGHHWQDSTQTSFAVFTAGVYAHGWKLEASWFNGREPDSNHYGLDLASLDSLSARLWLNPTPHLSAQLSYGHLRHPDALDPRSVDRFTASVTYNIPLDGGGNWASTLVWGRNARAGSRPSDSGLLESALQLSPRHVLFGRAEGVVKEAHELGLPIPAGVLEPQYPVTSLTLGYLYQLQFDRLVAGLGLCGTVNRVPATLEPLYSRLPLGGMVFLRLALAPVRQHTAGLPSTDP